MNLRETGIGSKDTRISVGYFHITELEHQKKMHLVYVRVEPIL
jgi:hypothetical protein